MPGDSSAHGYQHAHANRRLGWILFGIFAGLAVFSIVFIWMRSWAGGGR